MKKLALVVLLLMIYSIGFSQYHEVLYNEPGKPEVIRWIDEDSVYTIFPDNTRENKLYTIETKSGQLIIDANLSGSNSPGSDHSPASSDLMTNFDPSPSPNGDFIQKIAYTPDGELIAVLQKHSDNLVLYDAENYKVEQVIDLGREPMDMVVTNNNIYVCCHTAKVIQTVDLNTYSIVSTIGVVEPPCQLEINFKDSIAYLALDFEGTGNVKGGIAAYDLQTGDMIYETIDPHIYVFGRTGEFGRLGLRFKKFYLSPDGNKIIAQKIDFNQIGVYDAHNGNLLYTYNMGSLAGAGFSGSGDTMYMATDRFPTGEFSIYRINVDNMTILDSIAGSTVYYGGVVDLAINADGSRVLSSGDQMSTKYLFFDFNSYQYQILPASASKGNYNLVLVTSKRDYAIMFAGGYYDIIDLNTGQVVVSSEYGIFYGWEGAISPSDDKMFLSDGVCLYFPFENLGEKMYVVDIRDISSPITDTTLYAGNSREADETNMAWISNDGQKFISSNPLSQNISVVDIESGLTDTLIHYNLLSGLITIPGKNEAIAYSEENDTIRLIDLDTYQFIADVVVGSVDYVLISNDGQYAYILDYYTYGGIEGLITKVRLNGTASMIEDQIPANIHSLRFWQMNTGVVIQGVPALSPDGKYLLSSLKLSQDDYRIGVVDVEQMEVVASLPTESNGFCGFTFTDDCKWALGQCCNHSVPIIYLDGNNSIISSTFPVSYFCLSAAYNPVDGLFYALQDMYQYSTVDPETGEIINTVNTGEKFQFNIKIDNKGFPAILCNSTLLFKDESFPMIGTSIEMNYYNERDVFLISVPGPDKITVFGDLAVSTPEVQAFTEDKTFSIIPNPARESVQIKADFYIKTIEIIDLGGKCHLSEAVNGYTSTLSLNNLCSGIYLVRLLSDNAVVTQKIIVE